MNFQNQHVMFLKKVNCINQVSLEMAILYLMSTCMQQQSFENIYEKLLMLNS